MSSRYICEVCGRQFHNISNLYRHRKQFHTVSHSNQCAYQPSVADYNEKPDSVPCDSMDYVESQNDVGVAGTSDVVDIGMLHPFTAILSGPTGCGKTMFVFRFIEYVQELMFPQPEKNRILLFGISGYICRLPTS